MEINSKLQRYIAIFFEIVIYLPSYILWKTIKILPRNRNIWIFSSWFGQQYSDSASALYEYATKINQKLKCVWLLKNKALIKELRSKGVKAFYSNSIMGAFFLLRAGNVISITGYEFPLIFINGTNLYEIYHGMPLKKILRDVDFTYMPETDKKLGRLGKVRDKLKFTGVSNNFLFYENIYTVTNSDFFIPYLKQAFGIEEQRILKTGLPRCDKMFMPKNETLVEDIRKKYVGCKILLYMPTHRTSSWTGNAFNPFINEYQYDENHFLNILAEKNIVFLYKPHFHDIHALGGKKFNERFYTITNGDFNDIYDLIGQIDILMTDYSSIYFDYISLRKNVILAPFDLEDYKKTLREHYFDYNELDGVRAFNWKELLNILKNNLYRPASEEAIIKFAEYVSGDSCANLYESIIKNS